MTTVSPYPKVASDSLGAVLLIEVATGIVVQANHVAQQLAPDVPLPVSLERWFDAADLRVDTGSRLHSSEHLLWSIAQGEQVAGLTVTARRSSAQSEAREPLSVYGLPLHGALDLLGHALVLLLPVRYGDPDDEELVAAATDLRHRALLATALAFTLVDARDPELPLTWSIRPSRPPPDTPATRCWGATAGSCRGPTPTLSRSPASGGPWQRAQTSRRCW